MVDRLCINGLDGFPLRREHEPMATDLSAMQAHYELGREAGRLAEGLGLVELERTKEIVLRALPAPPAVVADIGVGPGRYALWLAAAGYRVEHCDLVSRV